MFINITMIILIIKGMIEMFWLVYYFVTSKNPVFMLFHIPSLICRQWYGGWDSNPRCTLTRAWPIMSRMQIAALLPPHMQIITDFEPLYKCKL